MSRDRRPAFHCACGTTTYSAGDHHAHLREGGGRCHTSQVTRALTDADVEDSARMNERCVRHVLEQLDPEERRRRRRLKIEMLAEKAAKTRAAVQKAKKPKKAP